MGYHKCVFCAINVALLLSGCSKSATPSNSDLVDTISVSQTMESNSTWSMLLKAANFTMLDAPTGPTTILVPSNAAFDALPDHLLRLLQLPMNKPMLKQLLQNHILPVKVPSTDLKAGYVVTTAGNESLRVTADNVSVYINDTRVLSTDTLALNGVVHAIDGVLDFHLAKMEATSGGMIQCGNYCGPDWCAGRDASECRYHRADQCIDSPCKRETNDFTQLPAPDSQTDHCCQQHDECCADHRRDCNRVVVNCLNAVSSYGPQCQWNDWIYVDAATISAVMWAAEEAGYCCGDSCDLALPAFLQGHHTAEDSSTAAQTAAI